MKSRTLLTVIAVCAIAGILAGVGIRELSNGDSPASDDPTAAPTTGGTDTPQTPDPSDPPALDELVIAPGAVGPVTVGMSSEDAIATGLIGPGPTDLPEGCLVPPIAWKKPYSNALDVLSRDSGEIASIGIWKKGPATADGLGIGSTFADVQAVADNADPEEAGFGQSGLFVFDSAAASWIGFLFDESVEDVDATSAVSFIEVTRGVQPSLMRSGC